MNTVSPSTLKCSGGTLKDLCRTLQQRVFLSEAGPSRMPLESLELGTIYRSLEDTLLRQRTLNTERVDFSSIIHALSYTHIHVTMLINVMLHLNLTFTLTSVIKRNHFASFFPFFFFFKKSSRIVLKSFFLGEQTNFPQGQIPILDI